MSSGLPSMAVAPVDELSNEDWSAKELNSFLLNEGVNLSGKRSSCWRGIKRACLRIPKYVCKWISPISLKICR